MFVNTLKDLGRSKANMTLSCLFKKSWTNSSHLNDNNECRNTMFLAQPGVNCCIFSVKKFNIPQVKEDMCCRIVF